MTLKEYMLNVPLGVLVFKLAEGGGVGHDGIDSSFCCEKVVEKFESERLAVEVENRESGATPDIFPI